MGAKRAIRHIDIAIVAVLAGALAFQLWSSGLWSENGEPDRPYLSGEKFRGDVIAIDGEKVSWPESQCWTAFVVDPGCGPCRQLAKGWSQSREPDVSWFFEGADSMIVSFVERFGIRSESAYRLTDIEGNTVPARALGFVATPTRIVFGPDRMASDVRVTHSIPGPDARNLLCAREVR